MKDNDLLKSADAQSLALRLKRFRQIRRLSLRQLGELTGTTASFLSQLERGVSGATTSTLMRIASALGVSISDLFDSAPRAAYLPMKRNDYPALPESFGCRKMLITRRPLQDLEVYLGEFSVAGSTGDDQYTHGGAHEMMFVLRGIVEISLGSDRHVLEEGDNIEYAPSTPHRTVNIGKGRAEVMWIIAPPAANAEELDMYVAGNRSRPVGKRNPRAKGEILK
jgi:transcriptional regulator with XRE-family HTH domain